MDAPAGFTPLQVRTLWLTAPVILGGIVYLLALDLWLASLAPDDEATISATYGKLLRLWPIVNTLGSVLFGVLIGHIAWGRDWSRVGRVPAPEPIPTPPGADPTPDPPPGPPVA